MTKRLFTRSARCGRLRLWRLIMAAILAVMPALISAAPALAAAQVQVKLNHPLGANLPVLDFRVSPDGSHVAYRTARTLPPNEDDPPPPPADLYSVPASGGTPVKINPPATAATETVETYQFSPDGSRITYLRTTTDATLGNVFELLSAPADGSSAPVSISGLIAVGNRSTRDFEFIFAPAPNEFVMNDGSVQTINFGLHYANVPERITNITDGTSNTFFFGEHPNNLLQTGEDGIVRRLNPVMVAGGVVYDFLSTPDGTRLIYRADQNLDGAIELFSIPADGSDAGFRISGPLVAGGDVLDFKINAPSTRAAYRADQTTNGVIELYSARTNGGIVAKLNAPLPLGGEVKQFEFSPDGTLVVYLADQIADEKYDLYAVAATGGQPTLLSSGLSNVSVHNFLISPDGTQVYYLDNSLGRGDILRVGVRPLALGAPAGVTLAGPPAAALPSPNVQISDDGLRLVYLADNLGDGIFELAGITRAPAPLIVPQINPPLVSGGNIRGFKISPDGEHVVYAADQNVAGVVELFKAPIAGGPVERISGALTPGGNVGSGPSDFTFSPDGRAVYYLADQETDNLTELFVAYEAPVLEWTQTGYVASEDGSVVSEFAVQRSGNVLAPAGVRVQLTGAPEGGTAQGGASINPAGVDFVDNVRDLVFAAGEITKTFTIPIKNDGVPEPAEDFSMQLFEPVQAVTGTRDIAQVTILDTANSPLLADANLTVPENSANGTQVGAPLPPASNTTYSILSGNTGSAFRIEANGALLVNNSAALNFEATPVFTLLVEALANNGSSDIATWTVNLQDQNEAPQIVPQTRSVPENSTNGTHVGFRLLASDPERNAFTSTVTSAIFDITAGGQLRVKNGGLLDFETQAQHLVPVTLTDSAGLSRTVTITVNVVDVAETDPSAITIDALSPASAVAGGKEFKLLLKGSNFTSTSEVRWNGSARKTSFSNGVLVALINAADIADVTTATIDVVDSQTKKTSAPVAFPVKKGTVGIADLSIQGAASERGVVGQTTVFNLGWTHTTQPWRTMNEMDLRLVDDDKIALWVRYQETRDENDNDISTVILLNADGTPAGQGLFGAAQVLENATVRIDLAQAAFQGSGPTGSNVQVRIPVVFKDAAAQDMPYTIEMYGVDDLNGEQGPNLMGVLLVARPTLYLPLVQR